MENPIFLCLLEVDGYVNAEPLSLPGLVLLTPRVFEDDRGFFLESWKASTFKALGIPTEFKQDNHSFSVRHTLRGLHYQMAPAAQGKLVRCVMGEIWDVAVDIRPESPTFGQWEGVVLNDANRNSLYLPPGFAHGFLVLSESAHVLYKATEEYEPSLDRGVRWDDPALAIAWPLPEGVQPLLSAKDQCLPGLADVAAWVSPVAPTQA